MPVSNDFQTLLTFAEAYSALSYSVIPLWGDADPSRPKVPALPWSAFQRSRSTLHDHRQWFTPDSFAGLGIVTGHISHLVVLDFDSEQVFADFRTRHPDLVDTHTVRSATRQLPHLYFRLPDHLHLESMKGQGIDLLSNGRYVVAPPTTINGQPYKVTRGGMPRTLTERDLRRIQSFLTSYKPPALLTVPPTVPQAQSIPASTVRLTTADDLQAIYTHLAATRGRNEALFHTSLFARDHHLTLHQAQTILAPLHAHQKSSAAHTAETINQRQHEASATIRSAFSRPPRNSKRVPSPVGAQHAAPASSPLPVTTGRGRGWGTEPATVPTEVIVRASTPLNPNCRGESVTHPSPSPLSHAVERGPGGEDAFSPLPVTTGYQRREPATVLMGGRGWGMLTSEPTNVPIGGEEHEGLPNSVRERLMQQKMTYVVRTYEALLQSGMRPGQTFTAAEALQRLKGVVGRDSVLKALNAGQGEKYFFLSPVSPQKTANAVAHSHIQKQSKKCFLIESKNQEKIERGRPPKHYKLPTNHQLCRVLGVKTTKSDTLEDADLRSARKTRVGLHRELIKRRSGTYSKRWLAARLGVSRRTIFTYTRLLPIGSRHMFLETPIQWATIQRLPMDEPLQGAYLQTVRGRKYPALRQIASRLLANGEALCLKQQTANFYWYGDLEPSLHEWAKRTQEQTHKQEVMESFVAQQPKLDRSSLAQFASPAFKARQRPASHPVSSPIDYKKPLENSDIESFAAQLCASLNKIGGTEYKKLSQSSARWLASTYDTNQLREALAQTNKRSASGGMRNPVGFFISFVRSSNTHR